MILFPHNTTPPPPIEPDPADDKTRNRVGIKGIFTRNLAKGERVTLAQAIEILRANW